MKKTEMDYQNGVIIYNQDSIENISYQAYLSNQSKFKDKRVWINVDGKEAFVEAKALLDTFQIHPIIYDHLSQGRQRAKIENYDHHIYISCKMVTYNTSLHSENLSILYAEEVLITFGMIKGDILEPLRKRLKNEKDPVRQKGSDYLLYSILDEITDAYFTVLEKVEEKIDGLEEAILLASNIEQLKQVRTLKRELLSMHKLVWPFREVVSYLSHEEQVVSQDTQFYFRDVHEHLFQVIDSIDTYRDVLSSLLDIYLSSSNMRLSEVMKILTIISTIFMPLTFIVGLYGMNFKYMPEIGWAYGYPFALSLMFLSILAMIAYFKHKHWF
ncbi:MAG: magnesium/cobalt transporter CorA [Erysipelotrichaceae bacterium]